MKALHAATRHPTWTYFILTFVISWVGVLVLVGPGGIPSSPGETASLFPAVYFLTIAGPSIAGILLTGLFGGRSGFRELKSRLLKWRVNVWWYAVAILTAPFTVLATLLILSLFSPQFMPGFLTRHTEASVPGILTAGYGFIAGLSVFNAFVEELGWTGFAIPRMNSAYGIFKTGLGVGLLWGAWHFMSNIWGSGGSSGPVPLVIFICVLLFTFLPPYRVLMAWTFDRTGSLFIVMVMHASLDMFWMISMPPGISPVHLVTWYLAWASLLWIVVAAVGMRKGFSKQVHSGQNGPRRSLEPGELI